MLSEYTSIKDDVIEDKYLYCNKDYQAKFDENLKKGFANAYKFSNHDIKKHILFLRKGVYPYKYIGGCENSMKNHYQSNKIFTVT